MHLICITVAPVLNFSLEKRKNISPRNFVHEVTHEFRICNIAYLPRYQTPTVAMTYSSDIKTADHGLDRVAHRAATRTRLDYDINTTRRCSASIIDAIF